MGSEVRLLVLFVGVAVLSLSNLQPQPAVVSDFYPKTGPISGGTLICITGEGFITTGSDRSKCNFEDTSFGSIISRENNVVNGSYMTCLLPVIDFLPPSVFASNGQYSLGLAVTARDSIRSETVGFSVYDLSTISIDSISPNEGINSTRVLITAYGSGFPNTEEASCSVDYDSRTFVPAAFINSSVYQCVLATYPFSSRVNVNVSLNGQPSANIVAVSQTATLFTFYASPPEITTCKFSPSYASLLLNFDREVEIGGESERNTFRSPNCNVIFDDEAMILLGTNAECSWHNSQQRSIVILLTSTSTVQADSILTLRGDNIRTRSVEYSRLAVGNVSVGLNVQSLEPIPILEAPSYIPFCGEFSVSAENSQHGGSRALKYEWVIGYIFTESGSLVPDDSFQDYVPTGFTNRSCLTIPSNVFLRDTIYTIQLTVRNFLNKESIALHDATKLNEPAPIVVILGAQVKWVRTVEEIVLEGTVSFPDCLNATGVVDYSWGVYDQMGLEIGCRTTWASGAVLTIPANSLLPGSVYAAVLTVSVGDRIGNSTVQLVTTSLDIRARIDGGSERVVSVQDILLLDGTISEGLSSAIVNDSMFTVTWNCTSITGTNTLCPIDPLESDTNLIYIIPNATLSTGVYSFVLTLRYHDVESKAYQIVHVVPHLTPRVEITPPLRLESIPVHEKLILQARVYSDYPGSVRWISEYVVGYAQLELSPVFLRTPLHYHIQQTISAMVNESSTTLFTSNITSSPYTNRISLTLNRAALLPGNSYRFTLTVEDILGHVGFAKMDLHTESLPLAGLLDIQPASGNPLATRFLLRASHWTDDIGNTPLSYQFGFQYPDEETIFWFSGVTVRNKISTILPLPSAANETLIIILQIYNTNGAVSKHQLYVDNLMHNSDTSFDLIELMQCVEDVSLKNGNWIEGIAHLTAIVASVNRYQDAFLCVDEFRERAVGVILQLFNSYIPQSKFFLNHLLFLLHEVTFKAVLPRNTSLHVVELLESLVQTFNNIDEKTSVISMPGFSEQEAELVFETYGSLILANSQREGTRIRSDVITESCLASLPHLGYGMCLQLGINEQASVTTADGLGSLKASHINLPMEYTTAQPCANCTLRNSEEIHINFGSKLFRQFLQWMCVTESLCSGVCIISAEFNDDVRWQGNPFSSVVKTPVLSLTLVNPIDGVLLQVQDLPSSPVTLSFPITAELSDLGLLECVFWSNTNNTWSNVGCTVQQIESTSVICECDHLSELAVIERCPSGYFGDLCSEVCPQGLWGRECRMSCDCNNRGTCSAHDGSCDCDPGWTGSGCQDACPEGFWGEGCSERCLCENGGDCDPVNGSCNCSTAPGWTGEYCNIGSECASICECRLVTECADKETGQCTCQPGFTGPTCHGVCPEGFYGNLCTLQCLCDLQGSESCDHVNGACYCFEQWTGEFCEIEVTPPPSPSPSPTPPAEGGFQIWLVAVAAIAVIAVVVVTATAVVVCWRVKHRRFKRVLPVSDKRDSDSKSAFSEDDVKSEEDELEITHAKSLEVLIPQGSKLKELFPEQCERSGDFREPAVLNGKIRWQIIQVFSDRLADGSGRNAAMLEEATPISRVAFKLGGAEEDVAKPNENDDSEIRVVESDRREENKDYRNSHPPSVNTEMSEILYERGVYLDLDATLKDLRNGIIASEQLDSPDRIFQFLSSDVPGDFIPIDTEDEVMLAQIEHNLVQSRTLYIEAIDPEIAHQELCICGKFADLECTECRQRGYCSKKCQDDDWFKHAPTCQDISAKRHRKHRRRKKSKAKMRSKAYTPSLELCVCGRETEFECSVCGEQGYCSENCQLRDWGYHERYCQSPSRKDNFILHEESRRKLATVEEEADEKQKYEQDSTCSIEGINAISGVIDTSGPIRKLRPMHHRDHDHQ